MTWFQSDDVRVKMSGSGDMTKASSVGLLYLLFNQVEIVSVDNLPLLVPLKMYHNPSLGTQVASLGVSGVMKAPFFIVHCNYLCR